MRNRTSSSAGDGANSPRAGAVPESDRGLKPAAVIIDRRDRADATPSAAAEAVAGMQVKTTSSFGRKKDSKMTKISRSLSWNTRRKQKSGEDSDVNEGGGAPRPEGNVVESPRDRNHSAAAAEGGDDGTWMARSMDVWIDGAELIDANAAGMPLANRKPLPPPQRFATLANPSAPLTPSTIH